MNANQKISEIRQKKGSAIEALKQRFDKATAAVVTDYQGMDVEAINKLRKLLRNNEIEYFVSKNTLVQQAIADTHFKSLSDKFIGINSIGLTYGDPSLLAKTLNDFCRNEERLKIRFGFLAQGERFLTAADVKVLSDLPSREVLLTKLAYLLKSQHSRFVCTLNEILGKFVRTVEAVRVKKQGQA